MSGLALIRWTGYTLLGRGIPASALIRDRKCNDERVDEKELSPMSKLLRPLGVVALLAFPVWVCGQTDPPSSSAPGGEEVLQSETKGGEEVPPAGDAPSLLLKPVAKLEWDEIPFEEVLDWIRDQSDDRINVIPRWKALNNDGVDADSVVSLKLTNTTVGKVLKEVLRQLTEEDTLRFRATANEIEITTQAFVERELVFKAYPVGDILFRIPYFPAEAPQIDLTGQNQQGGGGGGQGGQGGQRSVFAGGTSGGQQQGQQQENQQEVEQAESKLRDLILNSIAAESWADVASDAQGRQDAGLGKGRLRIYNRIMFVTNTAEVHEKIAGFLQTVP
jgi:hypothetical protein